MSYNKSSFSNANNVTFGSSGSVVTASASYPAQTAFQFSNANGVTFGTNGSTVTASVQTNYQTPGAYLTTAMASNRGSDFMGTNTALTANGVSMTANSNGLSLNFPAFLTTAMLSNAGSNFAGLGETIGTTTETDLKMTVDSQGVNISHPKWITTGALSDHSHGNPTLALTNLSGTTASNSAGFTLSLSAGAGGAGDGYNIVGINGVATSLSTTYIFSNGNNITFGLNAGTITASASYSQPTLTNSSLTMQAGASTLSSVSRVHFGDANGISFGASTSNNGSISITASHNGLTSQSNQALSGSNGSFTFQTATFGNLNGLSFYTSNGSLVGSHNGLTTARASNDAIGLNTAQTNVTWTVNSNGLSFNASGYVGTATGFSGTNVSATMTHNSAGFSLQLSAPAAGGGDAIRGIAAGGATLTTNTVNFSNSNNISFGFGAGANSTVMTADVGLAVSNSAGSFTFKTLNLSNANNVTFGTSAGSIITASVAAPGGGSPIAQYWAAPIWAENSHANLTNLTATAMTQRPFFVPFEVQGSLTAPLLKWVMSRATSGSNAFTAQVGIYSYANSTSLALIGSNQHVFSNTATASISGIKQFQVTLGTDFSTLPPGQYYLGMAFSAAATASMNYSLMGIATGNLPNQTVVLAGTNSHITYTSNAILPFWGRYSATTNAMPAGLTYGQVISQTSSNFQMNFTIGQSV